MDLIEYYGYGYMPLIIPSDIIYLLCLKNSRSLDLKVINYNSYNNRML